MSGGDTQTVVVIGSNSFSGGDFVDLLLRERDYRVVGVSRSAEASPVFLEYRSRDHGDRFAFQQIDLNHDLAALFEILERERPRYVVNFASQSEVAPSWDTPEQWFQTNAVAVAALGNFLRAQPWLERYVHISTPEVYGSCEGTVLEDAPMNPSTPYAASRAAGEMMLQTLVKSFDFPVSMTRASNVYGAHQQLFKIVPRTAIYVKLGRKLQLHGGGEQVRSFVHIRDVSQGELAVMEQGDDGGVYNLSPDGSATIREIVAKVCAHAGVRLEDVTETVPARTGNDAAYTIDSTKARERFGWRPKVSLDDGIAEVVDWVNRDWATIRTLPLEYIHKP